MIVENRCGVTGSAIIEHMSEDGAGVEPGGQLHVLLDRLDPTTATERELADALSDYDRVIAQATARQHQLIAELDRRRETTEKDWIREEVALALGVMPATAKDRLATSRTLVQRLPDTWATLARGEVTAFQATLLARAVDRLAPDTPDTVVRKIEAYVLRAAGSSYSAWKTRITQALHKYAPVDVAEARRAAQRDRTCWHKPGENETGTLVVHGPLDATMIAWSMIDDFAHALSSEGRSLEQRRFDAFASLFLGGRAWEKVQPVIEVTVPVTTLHGGDDPAELVGYGTINPETARKLAHLPRARWRRLVYSPATGHLCACGEKTHAPGEVTDLLAAPLEPPPPAEGHYVPSPRMRRYVKARDRFCIFPRCRRKARRSALDHTDKYFHGGATATTNLHPFCVRHHLMKDDPNSGWTLISHNDGSWTWIAPNGQRHTGRPHDYRGP